MKFLATLKAAPRLLLEVPLKPVQGHRFQPTGFPDLGAATYQAGTAACLLVESAQSMANRLEKTIWDEGASSLVSEAQGLSHVVVKNADDKYLTSSITEAHRLNSPYIIKDPDLLAQVTKACGADVEGPLVPSALYKTLFKYDINALLHGVFLEKIAGRLRVARSISGFVEAENVTTVASGGVKNDHLDPTGKNLGTGSGDGFGNVPFHREEFTAGKITAYFNLDLQQIRAFGLGEAAEHLLITLALYKIRTFLDGHLRFRTACDFEVATEEITARRPDGFALPGAEDLGKALSEAIKACEGDMETSEVVYTKKATKKKKSA